MAKKLRRALLDGVDLVNDTIYVGVSAIEAFTYSSVLLVLDMPSTILPFVPLFSSRRRGLCCSEIRTQAINKSRQDAGCLTLQGAWRHQHLQNARQGRNTSSVHLSLGRMEGKSLGQVHSWGMRMTPAGG